MEEKKLENKKKLDELREKLNAVIKEKENAKLMTMKIKEDTELLQENMTKKIVELNDGIDSNKKKEAEIIKEINEMSNKVVEIENKIKKKKEELKLSGYEYKEEDKEKKKKEEKKEEEKEKEKEKSTNSINNLLLNLAVPKPEIINEEKNENKIDKIETKKKKGSKKKKKKGK